jgi:hypothetical protein
VDFTFEKRNTGLEGLSVVRKGGQDHLLALCEGNRCRAGRKGRKPGGGRILVLRRKGALWRPVACIKLPRSLKFEDYAAVALRGPRIAVVSQASSKLWIGRLRVSDWTIAGPGRSYDFPRSRRGKIQYCTVEGLCWLSDRRFVMVSDLKKPYHSGRCAKKDQSIHLFALPGRARVSREHRTHRIGRTVLPGGAGGLQRPRDARGRAPARLQLRRDGGAARHATAPGRRRSAARARGR